MAKKLSKAEQGWKNLKDKGWDDQQAIMTYFIGKTVQSIESVDADITDAACVRHPGKQTTVTFTDGSGFTFDQEWAISMTKFPKGVQSPFSLKAAIAGK
jgi:hypothetical protein